MNLVKVGDYVQVEYFNDKYKWRVNYFHESNPNSLYICCPELKTTEHLVELRYCKKIPPPHPNYNCGNLDCRKCNALLSQKTPTKTKSEIKGSKIYFEGENRMNLEQAIAAMREGKKVRGINWATDLHVYINIDGSVRDEDGAPFDFSFNFMLNEEFELYEEPKPEEDEIKIGDYVQVEFFDNKYEWKVVGSSYNDYDEKLLIIDCDKLQLREEILPKWCKKISPPAITMKDLAKDINKSNPIMPPLCQICGSDNRNPCKKCSPHEYKVGDKVWVKGEIRIIEENKNHFGVSLEPSHIGWGDTYISELKPRTEDE